MRETLGIKHVAIKVKNFDNCLKFYTDILGMDIDWQPDDDNVYLSNGKDNLALHKDSNLDLNSKNNIFCKISGLGMADNQWTINSIKPWVLHCIESFTPNRSLFATNWPVDKLFSSYETLVNAYDEITLSFSKTERESMFSKNAETLYNI